jgi:ArsR family transcriptional regulator
MELTRDVASVYASWFRCLADPTRLLILNLLARRGEEMSVQMIVDALDVGQSTVSHHLRVLGETGFVRVRRDGTVRWWGVNERCIERFPAAAELVMGRVAAPRPARTPVAPWAMELEEASR